MKKINLILGACAFAAAALLASCNNGAKDLVNVSEVNNWYTYNVTGSLTTKEKSGTTASTTVTTTKATITTATANVSWIEDAVDEGNYDTYNIEFNGKADWTKTVKVGDADATTTKLSNGFGESLRFNNVQDKIENFPGTSGYYNIPAILADDINDPDVWANNYSATWDSSTMSYDWQWCSNGGTVYLPSYHIEASANTLELKIYEFDGDYYVKNDKEFVKLPEDAFDGEFGDKEFKLKYTTTSNTRANMTEAQKEDTTYVGSTETAYEFTFKLVEAE